MPDYSTKLAMTGEGLEDNFKGPQNDVRRLEEEIARERVALARVKFKRKRLSNNPLHCKLLMAMETDIADRLAALLQELRNITGSSL